MGGFVVLAMATILLYYKVAGIVLSPPVNSWTEDQRADCAVVLTGGPGRIREGVDLLAQSSVKKLIVSGVFPGVGLRDIFPQAPYYHSVSPHDIVLEKRSLTTFGNAQQSLALVEALRCRDVILVTSRLHMERALRIFRRVFPPDFPIYPRSVVSGATLSPRPFDVLVESTKFIFYSLWAF